MKVLIIHNEERYERYGRLLNELETQNITDYEIVPSVWDVRGVEHGINKAHKNCIQYSKDNNLEQIMVLEDDASLKELGIDYYKINRGGDITFHGPGQLVGYPILDLDNFFTDIHKYMRLLEEAVIRTCADYGIEAGRIEGLTGVWLDYVEQKNPRKICAMGVKASRWVTMHGFALNVNTDLSYFNHIIPCGIEDKTVTSLEKELGSPQDMQQVSSRMLKHLADLFEFVVL